MAATKTKQSSATRKVTVKLHGWAKEVKTFTVHQVCWFVDLEFTDTSNNRIYVVNHYTGNDYSTALERYNAIKVITA